MKLPLSLAAAFLLTLPAAAADNALLNDMRGMMGLFDGGAAMPRVTPPARGAVRLGAPVDAERWAPVPDASQAAPAPARPQEARDAFADLPACVVVDAVYVRQPSLAEAAKALGPCLDAVSKRYGASVSAAAGPDGRLTLRIPAAASGGALSRDLAKSLSGRNGRLLGWPARVSADLESARSRGVSALQPVIDRCAGPKMLPETAADFAVVYGDCLKEAKGLDIVDVRPDPADAGAVVVTSGARVETLLDMTGTVAVPALGRSTFRIEARRRLALAPKFE